LTQYSINMNMTIKFILALLAGIGSGVVTGLLLAPATGSKTRRCLSQTTEDLLDDLEDVWDEGSGRIKQLV